MTTNDIYRAINKDIFCKSSFLGVFPRDRLLTIYRFPCSVILNTEPSYKEGEHWLAMYFTDKRQCEFFDSYGNAPTTYGLEKYIKLASSEWNYNKQRIQGDSSASCGYYCIYFLLLKSRHFSLNDVVGLFSKTNFDLNDFKVEHIYD